MAIPKYTIVLMLALIAVSLAMPQGFQNRPNRNRPSPFASPNQFGRPNQFIPGAQSQAGGNTNTNTGIFGSQGSATGFGQASGPSAAFATGSASSSSGLGGSQATAGGTAFGF